MINNPMLISHGTLRSTDFSQRLRITKEAGYNAIGLNAGSISNRGGEYQRIRQSGTTDSEILHQLQQSGIQIGELEALVIGNDEQAQLFLQLARTFSVSVIQTIGLFQVGKASNPLDIDSTVTWLQKFSKELRPTGTRIALEFIPTTPIPDVDTAQMIVDRVSQPNVGICVDLWHIERGLGMSELEKVRWEHVFNVQISDGSLVPEEPDYIRDCIINRRCLAEGQFRVEKFIEYFTKLPSTTPIGIEVLSNSLDALTIDEKISSLIRSRVIAQSSHYSS
jgi:sugar phosphate isomerase/epimerase